MNSEDIDFFLRNGYWIAKNVFDTGLTTLLKSDLEEAIRLENKVRKISAENDPLQVVFCPLYSLNFLKAVNGLLVEFAEAILGEDCIIYSYSNSSVSPGSRNFAGRIHRERYYDTGSHVESIGALILLDDFMEENGATWFLPGSHRKLDPVSEDFFYKSANRLLAPAGSIFFFDPRLLHAGGANNSPHRRDALTIGFCRPYLKQRLSYPDIMRRHVQSLDDQMMQKLGFYALPPDSVEAFYLRGSGGYGKRNR